MEQSKKIIGYKAPSDLYSGAIKKGEVIKLSKKVRGGKEYEITQNGWTCYLPPELVESWEPVYSDLQTLVIGNNNIKLIINGDEIAILNSDGNTRAKTTYSQVSGLFETFVGRNVNIAGFYTNIDRHIRCIRIGCGEENNMVSLEELRLILQTCELGK